MARSGIEARQGSDHPTRPATSAPRRQPRRPSSDVVRPHDHRGIVERVDDDCRDGGSGALAHPSEAKPQNEAERKNRWKPSIAACAAAEMGIATPAADRCRSHAYSTPRNNISSPTAASRLARTMMIAAITGPDVPRRPSSEPEHLGSFPSRLVLLLDGLEKKGLVERRPGSSDRRSHALRLTQAGRAQLEALGRVSREHQEDICSGLSGAEKEQLRDLLGKMAAQQGLRPRVHPGYAERKARSHAAHMKHEQLGAERRVVLLPGAAGAASFWEPGRNDRRDRRQYP